MSKYARKNGYPKGSKLPSDYYKNTYRSTEDFKISYNTLCDDIKNYHSSISLINDSFGSDIKFKHVLSDPPVGLDFNDYYYYTLAKNNDYIKKHWSKIKWALFQKKDIIRKAWGESEETALELYKYWMTDARLVLKDGKPLNYLEYFSEQEPLLEQVHKKCDVIITHVGPDWSPMLPVWNMPPSTFFWFNGK